MELSYWEYKTWLKNTDFAIIGSGIVGLSCALHLRAKFPKAKITILEKGSFPEGASTKNAGFACFGSISEIIADLKHHKEDEVVALIKKRWQGIQLLKTLVPENQMQFQNLGGHELFLSDEKDLYEDALDQLSTVNQLLEPVFREPPFAKNPNSFGFKNILPQYITHRFEAQLDAGLMMNSLLEKARKENIQIINGVKVTDFTTIADGVKIETDTFNFSAAYLGIATNGFAGLLIEVPLKPARAQVLITDPIPGLNISGTFHLHQGFYYFRNIDNRILLGGGRHLDLSGETTSEFGQSSKIQEALENLLRTVILPDTHYNIEMKWSGIMGVGEQKTPILQELSPRVACAVRLGGMGVAIGSLVGKDLADMLG